jgi:hypothetical protein
MRRCVRASSAAALCQLLLNAESLFSYYVDGGCGVVLLLGRCKTRQQHSSRKGVGALVRGLCPCFRSSSTLAAWNMYHRL